MDGCRDGPPRGPPPTLPPRGRHRARHGNNGSVVPHADMDGGAMPWWKSWMRKYVIACLVCGGLSVVHGIVFIIIYLLLRSYTTSLQFFETIPTYVPGVVFIITGLILMCFAKRRNRYAFLMRMAGGCCLICALLCVVITVTTTVVHMNRLQTLHECVYTPQSKTCMCVSAIGDHNAQEAHRFVFNNTPNCEVVHGSLYSCLRALFSFSVLGMLLCISCSMLLYQLLSHEKKRVYWEQLELRRRFLYQRHPHHAVCGCYDELYPWPLWEMLDYRLLSTHNNMGSNGNVEEDPCPPPSTAVSSRNIGSGGGGHRPSGWNWLPWPRQNATRNRNRSNLSERPVNSEETPSRQNFMRRLMSRDSWNQQQLLNVNNSGEETPALSDTGSLPWRSECIHIFRPNPRNNANCFAPMRFGIRSRNSPYGRPHSNHRRTRSNDGVFHHLHMNPAPRYTQPYSLVDTNGGITCHYSGCEIPRYMWGPPPPYSQPPSTENITLYNENNQIQNRRSSMGIEQLGGGIELTHCDQVLTALEIERAGNGSMSSKMSTPLSERRFVCHNFSAEGITLTIGGNYPNICSQDTVPNEHKREETCIVEVHVPYIFHNKKDIVFNTLPARSCRKKDSNPFKSLSNIPLGLSRKINNLKNEKSDSEQLSVIKGMYDFDEISNFNTQELKDPISQSHGLKTLSKQLFGDGPSINNSLERNTSPSSLSFQPTIVEVPSEFKSSLILATSPSTPVMENINLSNKVYAQSMPNLNTSNSSLPRHIRRAPSSGNTSTSQDFGDYDFEDDSSPFVLCSPVSDIPSLPPLPDDDASDSSSSYPPCPRIFRCDHEAPFSNDSSSCEVTVGNAPNSDSSSCDVIVIGDSDKRHSRTLHCRSSEATLVPFTSSPSIIISKRPPTECSINCNIRHLHHYHPEKIEVREIPERMSDNSYAMNQERTSNFVVTIKSVNV